MSERIGPELADVHALTRQLLAVSQRARADFADVVSEFGLTPQQARAVLWLEQPSPMVSMAEHLSCDASNVTGLADRLESQGLVERVAGSDRRVKVLRLTARGKQLRARLAARVARDSTVGAQLNDRERAQLRVILNKLLS